MATYPAQSKFCRPEEDPFLLLDRASSSIEQAYGEEEITLLEEEVLPAIAQGLARIDAIDSAHSAGFCSQGRWRSSELFPCQVRLTVLVYRAHLSVRQSLEEKGLVRAGYFSVRRWRNHFTFFAPYLMAASPKSRSKTSGPSPEEALVRDLIELLEAGSMPWRKPWDCHTGGVHINLLTGRAYRGSNPILLELGMAMSGAELPFWCGFSEAKKLGISPRKGSKSVRILRPQLHSSEKEASNGEKVLHSWASYRPVPVFNAGNLEGDALRLKRDQSGAFGSSSYAREELVAELGSVLMGQRLQTGCELSNHAAYLQSWISVLRESPKVLLQVISAARQAVDQVCPEMECTEVLDVAGANGPATGQDQRRMEAIS